MNKRIKIPIISTTHWDREWRFSFQQTRSMLVDLMDNLINILQNNPDFKHYHLDGQTVILEDYLAIRPQKAKELKELIEAGRILIGPWYTLPDFCVINGESIIRNLLMGHSVAKKFGDVMKVGYTPTGFGQVSQMPQIYNGFDIDTMLFYRGVDRSKLKKEFIWEAADGSRVIAYTFTSEFGRMPLFHCIASKVFRGKDFYVREHEWESNEGAFRLSDSKAWKDIYYHMYPKQLFICKSLQKDIKRLFETELKHSMMDTFLLVDGVDSTEPQPKLPDLIKKMNSMAKNILFYHSDLPDFAAQLRKIAPKLDVYKGEMRHSAKDGVQVNLMGSAISSRIYLKQKNREVENELLYWAEPFSAFALLLGTEYPKNYLDMAWKYLLWNQSHDSIAGCSQDIVHEDMMYYFRQSREIADVVTEQALRNIAANINMKKFDKKSILLIVYNPLSFARTEVISAMVDISADENFNSLKVIDDNGNVMSTQLNAPICDKRVLIHRPKDVPCFYKMKRVSIQFQANNIPPLGYKVFAVLPQKKKLSQAVRLSSKERTLCNEYISVKVNPDGTYDLKDLKTGRMFRGLNQFEDSGEVGDPWIRKEPKNNRIFYGLSVLPKISVYHSELSDSIKVSFSMEVPFSGDQANRSRKTASIDIETTATLKKACRWLEFYTKVNNRARDHRLRVLFPSCIKSDKSFAESAFDINERNVKPSDTKGWFENGYTTYPQHGFCGIRDENAGLAVFNKGLPEYEVIDDSQRTIAITLLRCYKMFIPKLKEPDSSQEGCQCLGTSEFEYAVYPFADKTNEFMINDARAYQLPFKVAQTSCQKGSLSLQMSFLKVNEPLVISAIKQSENQDSVVVRLYNPTLESVDAVLSFYKPLKFAHLLNLHEKRSKKLLVHDNHNLKFQITPKKIVTLEVSPQ